MDKKKSMNSGEPALARHVLLSWQASVVVEGFGWWGGRVQYYIIDFLGLFKSNSLKKKPLMITRFTGRPNCLNITECDAM